MIKPVVHVEPRHEVVVERRPVETRHEVIVERMWSQLMFILKLCTVVRKFLSLGLINCYSNG